MTVQPGDDIFEQPLDTPLSGKTRVFVNPALLEKRPRTSKFRRVFAQLVGNALGYNATPTFTSQSVIFEFPDKTVEVTPVIRVDDIVYFANFCMDVWEPSYELEPRAPFVPTVVRTLFILGTEYPEICPVPGETILKSSERLPEGGFWQPIVDAWIQELQLRPSLVAANCLQGLTTYLARQLGMRVPPMVFVDGNVRYTLPTEPAEIREPRLLTFDAPDLFVGAVHLYVSDTDLGDDEREFVRRDMRDRGFNDVAFVRVSLAGPTGPDDFPQLLSEFRQFTAPLIGAIAVGFAQSIPQHVAFALGRSLTSFRSFVAYEKFEVVVSDCLQRR